MALYGNVCKVAHMTTHKVTREESLARAHEASRRKRLDRMADELRSKGWMVVSPENLSSAPHADDYRQRSA